MSEDEPHECGLCECRLCGHRGVAVWPVNVVVGRDNTECPNCGNMTCGPLDEATVEE